MANYTVAFVKIVGNEDDVRPAGSGTLVSAGGSYGILTADHVLETLPRNGEFGLVLPSVRKDPPVHRCLVDVQNIQKLTIGKASQDNNGPDLGLIVLGHHDYSWLQARKSFYNLERRREQMLSDPPVNKFGLWYVSGMAAERTSDLPPERSFTRVKGFHGLCCDGEVTAERTKGPYDYFDFEVKYHDEYDGPQSFEGFSGGGLWQIVLKEASGKLHISEILLSGVAFYQSDRVDDIRTIYCHGRKSVYEATYSVLVGATNC